MKRMILALCITMCMALPSQARTWRHFKLAWTGNGNPKLPLYSSVNPVYPCLKRFSVFDLTSGKMLAHVLPTANSYSWTSSAVNHTYGVRVVEQMPDGGYRYSTFAQVTIK